MAPTDGDRRTQRPPTRPIEFARSSRPIVAVLGPTNTGKTFYAMDRMAAHQSGIMGFPLRLLARENYDKMVARKGAGQVALITGEEKIIPRNPRYWICTVESMPLDLSVEFLAVDEIQLCSDPDRGYLFTDRLLHARGVAETVFLGATTIRPIIERLFPDTQFLTRPRLSDLSYVTPKKLSRIPPRSAIVAFSANEVYRIAEMVRQQRGGTAVVLGALSPRTRNAQVEMYQAGEVDYLVATDAIGMGLNMDIDHVTFGGIRKFDGRRARGLNAQEIGQIAGRAGRHMNDGTFTTSADISELDEEIVEAVENHRYNPLKNVFWRNRDLDFRSVPALLRSLDRNPGHPELLKAREADDHVSLRLLAKQDDIFTMAQAPAAVRLLWDVCQVPDFRKTFTDTHGNMLARIYRDLITANEIDADWVGGQIKRLENTEGDIDTLVNRIANVRTWTYISHHAGWLTQSTYWQERTRAIEDQLSDALHERLTNQFVDRRSAIVMRRIKEGATIEGAIQDDGKVVIESEFVGTLNGFDYQPDPSLLGSDGKPMLSAARKVVKAEVDRRFAQLLADNDGAFCFGEDGGVQWRGTTIASLVPSDDVLSPKVRFKVPELLTTEEAAIVEKRLSGWIDAHLKNAFGFHDALREGEAADQLSPSARGLAYQLWEGLGVLERGPVREMIRALTPDDRKALRGMRVRFGRRYLWTTTLRSDRAKRALTTLRTAFPEEPRYNAAAGIVAISAGRDRTRDIDLDVVEKALSRIWWQAEPPKKKIETVDDAKVPADATTETTIETPAEAPIGTSSEAPTEPAAEVSADEAQSTTEPAPAAKSQEELDAERDADLLKICSGDEQLIKSIWFLPEARGKRPARPENTGNRNQRRKPAGTAADGASPGPNAGQRRAARVGGKPGGKPSSRPDEQRGNDRPKRQDGRKDGGQRRAHSEPKSKPMDPNSPFAALAGLKFDTSPKKK